MLDDGLGCYVYSELQSYDFPENVQVHDLGCLTLDRINDVRDCDTIITVDALDGTGHLAGTLFRFDPQDMAKRSFGTQSLHDLRLSDLFDSAFLLGYTCEGVCLGMQVENPFPSQATIGLSPSVEEKLPDLVDLVLAELVRRDIEVVEKDTGQLVVSGFHHRLRGEGAL